MTTLNFPISPALNDEYSFGDSTWTWDGSAWTVKIALQASDFGTQVTNTVLAAPSNSSGLPSFRTLQVSDVPVLNQNTTGNAATATALQTARTINGVSFDGTSNITVADSTKQPLDADLTAIAALSGTSGLLRKTAANTWSLDTNAYVTSSGVTSVSGTAPIVSSGGTTPAISITAATITAAGSMSAADKSKLDGIAAGAQVNVATNLTYTAATTTGTVNSSTGTNATIPAATTSLAGLMTNADKTKLDGIAAGAQVNVATNLGYTASTRVLTSSTGTSVTLPQVTTSADGLMIAADKTKLNGIATGATANTGTVTSVGGTGGYGGLTLSGTVTTSGNLTLGGTPTGTWPISVSGNAATATSADQIDGIGFRNTGSNSAVNADTLESNGVTYYTSGVPNFSGNATDGALYSQAYSSSWQHQIAGDYRSGQIALRGKNNGTWQAWRTVLDSSNYNTYAPTKTGTGASGTWSISITGNAATATALQTARTIGLSGDVTGSVSFNGSANVTIAATVADDSHDHVWGNIDGASIGSLTGPRFTTPSGYIEFGPANTTWAHIYTDRPNFYLNKDMYVLGNRMFHDGYHPNADTLTTARTINGTSFNGSANITTANWGTARTLSFTGDATGSASVNGSTNVATALTLANSGVTAGTYTNATVVVDAKGRVTSASSGTSGSSVVISDDTTTNATRYPVFEDVTSGTSTTMQVSSTKYTFNPSTGTLTATVLSASSDERFKSEWYNLPDDYIFNLSKLKVGTYVHALDDTRSRQIGVSAQSLLKFCPEGVAKDDKGYLSVAYGNVALASSAVLAKRVIELEERIAKLEKLLG